MGGLLLVVPTVGIARAGSSGNVAVDEAAKLFHGVDASLKYQLYTSPTNPTPKKIDGYMALVLGAVKAGLKEGIDTADLKTVHDMALNAAIFDVVNTTEDQQTAFIFNLVKDVFGASVNPRAALWKAALDTAQFQLQAFKNASGGGLARNAVIGPLQPQNFQVQINNYFISQMSDAYDVAKANPGFAQKFDSIFQSDLGSSITDNSSTLLNGNLDLPDYFRLSVNADGSLTVDIDGLKNVYTNASQALSSASSDAITLAQAVDQAERQSLLSNASPTQVLQSVPTDLQNAVKNKYLANQKSIALAAAGIDLASNLAGFFDAQTAQEISVYGNAAVQVTTALNYFMNGTPTLLGGVSAVGAVVQGTLAVYNLIQSSGHPSSDQVIQSQLAALGHQIDQLRTQMNARFDIIDANINTIFQTLNTNFNIVIPELGTIIQQLADLQGNLTRFEQNVYHLELAGFLANLDSSITGCIAFRDITGHNMSFAQYSGSTGCENTFYSWGTANAINLATVPPGAGSFDDANIFSQLSHPSVDNPDFNYFAKAADINYFRLFPQKLGLAPLWPAPIANPSVFEIAAQSHLQLAIENPAYDATLSPTRVADIIAVGTNIQTALKNITASSSDGGHPLLDKLISNYSAKVSAVDTGLGTVEENLKSEQIQSARSTLLSAHPTIDGCGGQAHGMASPSTSFNVDGTFLLADHFSRLGRSGFGSVTACVDLGFINVVNGFGDLAIYLNNYYDGHEILSVYIPGNTHVTATQAELNFFWAILPQGQNWNAVKAAFEGNDPTSPVRQVFPCIHNGDVVICGHPEYTQLLSQTASAVAQDALYQTTLYCRVISDFDGSGTESQAIQGLAVQLAGAREVLRDYVVVGLPNSSRTNDYLRAKLYGNAALPGRSESGQDDFVGFIYGPALLELTGASTVNQACGASAVISNQPHPKVDPGSIIGPRVSALSSTIAGILSSLDAGDISESDETLDSLMLGLRTFHDTKVSNAVSTPTGANVQVHSPQNVTVTFNAVVSAGVTVTTLTDASQAVPTQAAYDVETTATYVGPVVSCFSVPSVTDPALFAELVIYHSEGTALVDRTFSRDFGSKTLCAKTDTLGPFIIALSGPSVTAPAVLTVASTGANGAVRLTWSPVVGATGYTIRRAGTSGSETTLVTGVSSTSVVDSTVIIGHTYYYTVTALGTSSESAATYEVSITAGRATAGDFDGDGESDLSVYRPSNAQWLVLQSSTNYTTYIAKFWGVPSDIPVPGDYDGDGKVDFAVYRPSTAEWFVLTSSSGYTASLHKFWGVITDVPVPGDYDGDGQVDFAVYRPATAEWFVLTSSSGYTASLHKFWGVSTDVPVPGDYDGDGKVDPAVYRPSTGEWFVLTSGTGYTAYIRQFWGLSTDVPVLGDFDGDGKADPAVYRPSTAQWFVLQSSTNYSTYIAQFWGLVNDVPVPTDYDGDGKVDPAVYRPSTGEWFVLTSASGYSAYVRRFWGLSTDIPNIRRP